MSWVMESNDAAGWYVVVFTTDPSGKRSTTKTGPFKKENEANEVEQRYRDHFLSHTDIGWSSDIYRFYYILEDCDAEEGGHNSMNAIELDRLWMLLGHDQ